jgi:hypothetical protein
MVTYAELDPEVEGFAEADEAIPQDVWERLWEEWEPFSGERE